ncbi:MAG: ABC-type transport auxiliary lipoprotein family protein [Dokdonella sp.]|uniref:ABC-type transport auxiliary lipoprotein family protein n=1 Tax=Dokdonella sp. TaxID=2291710 RepID=UPI003263AB1B
MKRTRFLVPVLVTLLTTACSSLLNVQRTPFTVYAPQVAPLTASTEPPVDWQLVIETPLASDTLDSARIAVMPTPGVLEVFPAARWRDSAPAMLRGLIVLGFETSHRIVGVGSSASGLRGDYSLAIELHDFQLEIRDGSAHAAVRLQARLLDYTTNRVLATRAFAQEAPAAGTDAASAFVAFQASLNALIPELVDWTLHEGSMARSRSAPRT